LDDPKGLLVGSGLNMRHIKITNKQDIDQKAITDFVVQSVTLNKELGDTSR
jgi:hypothetical protein